MEFKLFFFLNGQDMNKNEGISERKKAMEKVGNERKI